MGYKTRVHGSAAQIGSRYQERAPGERHLSKRAGLAANDRVAGVRERSLVANKSVWEVQNSRSLRARLMDASMKAPLAKTQAQWMRAPNRFDLRGVDYPEKGLKETTAVGMEKIDGQWYKWYSTHETREEAEGFSGMASVGGKYPVKIIQDERGRWSVYRQYTKPEKELPGKIIRTPGEKYDARQDAERRAKEKFDAERQKQELIKSMELPEKPELKDPEKYKHLTEFPTQPKEDVQTPAASAQMQTHGSVVTYNKATGWMAISFADIPSPEIRAQIKQEGFRWNPVRKQWVAKWTPERENVAEKVAGKMQTVDIAPNWAAKAEHAESMALKHQQEADETSDRFHKEMDAIPFGQPILVGHHSEKSHRAHLARLENMMHKSVEEDQKAKYYEEKAERLADKAHGESPGLLFRRIKRMETEKRQWQRAEHDALMTEKYGDEKVRHYGIYPRHDLERIRKSISHLDEQISREKASYAASGGIALEKQTIQPGDIVRTKVGLSKVVRVNPTTITVLSKAGKDEYNWKLKLDKSEVYGKVEQP